MQNFFKVDRESVHKHEEHSEDSGRRSNEQIENCEKYIKILHKHAGLVREAFISGLIWIYPRIKVNSIYDC